MIIITHYPLNFCIFLFLYLFSHLPISGMFFPSLHPSKFFLSFKVLIRFFPSQMSLDRSHILFYVPVALTIYFNNFANGHLLLHCTSCTATFKGDFTWSPPLSLWVLWRHDSGWPLSGAQHLVHCLSISNSMNMFIWLGLSHRLNASLLSAFGSGELKGV